MVGGGETMTENPMTLHTQGKVAVTSSKGNQEKWFEDGLWYKLDTASFESLAETVASQLLQKTNIPSELGYTVVPYEITQVVRNGQAKTACVSPNFLKDEETIVTADHLLRRSIGMDYQKKLFNQCTTFPQIMTTFVEAMVDATGLSQFGSYLTVLFECDALMRNVDRHLNNIAVLRSPLGYDYCPIFDNGMSFLLNPIDYPPDISMKALAKNNRAQPFRYTFGAQARGARKLYGRQLKWDIPPEEVSQIVTNQLHHYSPMYHTHLQGRVIDCVELGVSALGF